MNYTYFDINHSMKREFLSVWDKLISGSEYEGERNLLKYVSKAIGQLPAISCNVNVFAEVEYFWEDSKWLGYLTYKDGEFSLWLQISQKAGDSTVYREQWDGIALQITLDGVRKNHAGYVWVWLDMFKKFVSACHSPKSDTHGTLKIYSGSNMTEICVSEKSSDYAESGEYEDEMLTPQELVARILKIEKMSAQKAISVLQSQMDEPDNLAVANSPQDLLEIMDWSLSGSTQNVEEWLDENPRPDFNKIGLMELLSIMMMGVEY